MFLGNYFLAPWRPYPGLSRDTLDKCFDVLWSSNEETSKKGEIDTAGKVETFAQLSNEWSQLGDIVCGRTSCFSAVECQNQGNKFEAKINDPFREFRFGGDKVFGKNHRLDTNCLGF